MHLRRLESGGGGVGLAILLAVAPSFGVQLPLWLRMVLTVVAIELIANAIVPSRIGRLRVTPAYILGTICLVGLVIAGIWQLAVYSGRPNAADGAALRDDAMGSGRHLDQVATLATPPSVGGKGGDASVIGSGLAIGGPGGHGGSVGRGGEGGSARVVGNGIAAGGEGGSVDSNTLWSPPARSGYEIATAAIGERIRPFMRQFGRGGMSPGYAERYRIVEKIRADYFAANHSTPKSPMEDINAVPLDYVNEKLATMNVNWRARLVNNGLDYEFYVPDAAR